MKFINLPQKLNLKFYKNCQKQFVNLCRQNPDILAVYTAGSVSTPGISDLDFIICLKDKLSQPLRLEERFDNDLKYILAGGSILKVNQNNFKSIKIIDDFKMTHTWGKEFDFQEFDSQEFELCRIMDWLPERLFTLLKLKNSQEIDVMRGLGIIKSAAFSLEKLAILTGNDNYNELSRQGKKLRVDWFKNKDLKSFINLLEESVEEVERGIQETVNCASPYMSAPVPKNKDIYFAIKNGPRFLFSEKIKVKNREVILPYHFYYFLAAQALLGKGFIGKNLRQCFDQNSLTKLEISDFIDMKLVNILKKRIDYCDQVASFFMTSDLKKGLLKYGWFLNH